MAISDYMVFSYILVRKAEDMTESRLRWFEAKPR